MTNLVIANVETLSHDDSYSYSFSSDGRQFGVPWPISALDPPLTPCRPVQISTAWPTFVTYIRRPSVTQHV